jgi:ABC-2 type transport system ATP-binding protein
MSLSQPLISDQAISQSGDSPAVFVKGVKFHYGRREALSEVDFTVSRGEIFGLLGPNGGGKTTVFRLLATLLRLQSGEMQVLGFDVSSESYSVRRRIGVTFQSPSIDGKLTVAENLRHQAHLYGLVRRQASMRIAELVEQLGLKTRERQLVSSLSGGLKRRVEIAKSLLHRPALLLLDEPSTGLDPGARSDLWSSLIKLRAERNVTILVTTHLMDEADRCDQLGILDRGRFVARGTPDALRQSVGGDCLTIQTTDPRGLSGQIASKFGLLARQIGDSLRIEQQAGHELLRNLVVAFPAEISSISLAKPTLEDVFVTRTGHRFWDPDSETK